MNRLLDGLWLLILAGYILAGMALATFHGDEAMQIYMSHDYVTAFIEHEPARLMVTPPYYIDDAPWLRILNGSVNRYAIGLSWHLAGLNSGLLPPRPGWDWGLDYDRNVETGHRPSEALMSAGRISSTVFLVVSAWIMFGIGWVVSGRLLAYLASGLYTLNPIILLNGRRAMMEGSMLSFGLLAIFIAVIIVRKRDRGIKESLLWWLALVLASGLTLASKHSGVLFVAGAFGWIFAAAVVRFFTPPQPDYREGFPDSSSPPARCTGRGVGLFIRLAVSGILVIGLFIALSPALWNDPPARFRDLIEQRQGLIDIQVASFPDAPTTLPQRIEAIIKQPFMTPLAHYEVSFWANAVPIQIEIERYMTSTLSGLTFGAIGGIIPTLLAGVGLIIVVWHWRVWQFGMLVWIGLTIVSLLVNPLPWQRYYLPWIPVMTLLAVIGFVSLWQRLSRPQSSPANEYPLVNIQNRPDTTL